MSVAVAVAVAGDLFLPFPFEVMYLSYVEVTLEVFQTSVGNMTPFLASGATSPSKCTELAKKRLHG